MTLEAPIPLKARTGTAAKARTGIAAIAALTFAAVVMPLPAMAGTFVFSTGDPDHLMATAVRPDSPGKFEIEAGDDFVLTQQNINLWGGLHRPDPVGSVHKRYKECSRRGVSRFSRGCQRGSDERAADIFDAERTNES
jgi:hypothetical protein